jgi:biopolymer transport protein ExbB
MLLAQESAPAASRTLMDYIREGGTVGFILIGLSIAALALMIVHLIQVRITRMAPPDIIDELGRLLRENDVVGATKYCGSPDNECFLTRTFHTALVHCSRSPFGFLEMRNALEESGQREVDNLNRTTDALGLIAAVGPMLGLLGTVFGMIGAFGSISDLEGAARSKALAGFMSLALINTAQGLAVAIPCTIAFSIFRRRVDRLAGLVAEIAEGLALFLDQRSGAEKAPARPQPRPAPARPTVERGVQAP